MEAEKMEIIQHSDASEEEQEGFAIVNTPHEEYLFRLANSGAGSELMSFQDGTSSLELHLNEDFSEASHLTFRSIWNLTLMIETAAANGSTYVVESLLELGHRYNVPYHKLVVPNVVKRALAGAHVDVLRRLFRVLPELVSMDLGNGTTALRKVISDATEHQTGRYVEIVGFLLMNGSDPNHTHPEGYRLLYIAAKKKQSQIVDLLLRYGAKTKFSGAVHAAVASGAVDVLDLLFKRGADINDLLNNKGKFETPLHTAIRSQQKDCVQWLLNHGALVTVENFERRTALQMLQGEKGFVIEDISCLEKNARIINETSSRERKRFR